MESHVGRIIKAEFDRHPKTHSVTWLAEQLHCNRTNVYNIFNRKTIDTDLLMRISEILNHDFFHDISMEMKKNNDNLQSEKNLWFKEP